MKLLRGLERTVTYSQPVAVGSHVCSRVKQGNVSLVGRGVLFADVLNHFVLGVFLVGAGVLQSGELGHPFPKIIVFGSPACEPVTKAVCLIKVKTNLDLRINFYD